MQLKLNQTTRKLNSLNHGAYYKYVPILTLKVLHYFHKVYLRVSHDPHHKQLLPRAAFSDL